MAEKIEDVTLQFELSVQEVNQVLQALGKLTLEESVGTWAKIKQTAEAQLAEKDIEKDESANDSE